MRLLELESPPSIKNQPSDKTSSKRESYKDLPGFNSNDPKHMHWITNFRKQRHDALRTGKLWTVSLKEAWDLINKKQDWKCALSGVEFSKSHQRDWYQASLDRINSSLGYVQGNVQYITLAVNYAKREMPQEKFVSLCKQVAAHTK